MTSGLYIRRHAHIVAKTAVSQQFLSPSSVLNSCVRVIVRQMLRNMMIKINVPSTQTANREDVTIQRNIVKPYLRAKTPSTHSNVFPN